MTGNKTFFFSLAVAAAFLSLPASAAPQAEMAQPQSVLSLAFVDEIVIQTPRLGNPQDSRKCGIYETDVSDLVYKSLKDETIPVFPLLDSPPLSDKKSRIYLVPEVTTMEIKEVACVSYLSLTAKSQETMVIYPVDTPRNVTVNYWGAGIMINSSQAGHKHAIAGGFDKLAVLFSRDFRLAQPPDLSSSEKPSK